MFHWPSFFEAFPALMSGLAVTIELTLLVMPCALVVALALAVARLYGSRPLARVATGWVEVWRGAPLLVQVYLVYYMIASEFRKHLPSLPTVALPVIFNGFAFLSQELRPGRALI